ncbi:alpha/beta hydrolase-fold protein, partial [Thermus scotoductus]|uniref:alpha/beta hydrolase-fold protein n=1 Tax=Thermus scotoductus TaxID=37636 RepID=UPI003F50EEB1
QGAPPPTGTGGGFWNAAEAEGLPRIYLEVGLLEWLLAPVRRVAALLADRKVPHAYRERPSGHNWVTWKQALAPGLASR